MSTRLQKAQGAVATLEGRLAEQQAAKTKAETELATLKGQWGELVASENGDKALTENERAQVRAEREIERATGRSVALRKRLNPERERLERGEYEAAIVELRSLEAESVKVYALYREKAIELVALAGSLDSLEREVGSLKMRHKGYAQEHGLPGLGARMRHAFGTGAGAWWDQYGPNLAMEKFLAWLRRNEDLLGWR